MSYFGLTPDNSNPIGLQPNFPGLQPVATGDLKCQMCPQGGSWGTTGMYRVTGKVLCAACATKQLGGTDLSGQEKIELLRPFTLQPR